MGTEQPAAACLVRVNKVSGIIKADGNKSTCVSLIAPVSSIARGRVFWRMRHHYAETTRAWAGLKPAPTETTTA
ncbi:MAG: hypothetical protein NTV33_07085 [Coprothermobacterota bacterium]|nr:hypothetical protein [Coprothermobacterota bacterium]